MRTQGTFGAATPGRRVLYSASWVLVRLRRGGDAARTVSGAPWAGQPPVVRKSDKRLRWGRWPSSRIDLTSERDGEGRSEALDLVPLERVDVVAGEVRVIPGLEQTFLLLLMC